MNTGKVIVLSSLVAVMIIFSIGTGFAAGAGACPAGSRNLTIADHGLAIYPWETCVPVQNLKGSPPRRMTIADGGMDAYHFERYTAGTEGSLKESTETVEIGGRVYRVGIDLP